MLGEIKERLLKLTGCNDIKLVKRGNKAILYALRIAKDLGKTKVIIQDQGGWITYKQYPFRMKMDTVELKTDYGIIDKDSLFEKADNESVLLINSMPGYLALEDMKTVESICKDRDCMIINDISGSIGTDNAKYGDIVVCSFGKDKPVSYGEGGFIGVRNRDYFEIVVIEEIVGDDDLFEKLATLGKRLEIIKEIRRAVIEELRDYEIIHPDKQGINIAVCFSNEQEKEKVINYCDKSNLEYTICPRYIRVGCDAVSIEIKRLFIDDKYKMIKIKEGD